VTNSQICPQFSIPVNFKALRLVTE